MKFFVPGLEESADPEAHYEAMRKFSAEQMEAKIASHRIYKVSGVHNGKPFTAAVGEPFENLQEIVAAILLDERRRCYLICTANRGWLRGMPYLSGSDEIRTVEYFEGYTEPQN